MPVTKIEKASHLIIDNSVLSMLTECHCAEHVGTPGRELLDLTENWIIEYLSKLRTTSIEGKLHTTDLVCNEYKPEKGHLGTRSLPPPVLQKMSTNIKGQFEVIKVDEGRTKALRTLPGVPKRLVHPVTGLSDNDLSLVQLGLEMTKIGNPIVMLSNDQDLIDFTTWAKTQTSLRIDGQDPSQLEVETGLGYLELIHRSCLIPSDQMTQMINYVITTTVSRMEPQPDGTQLNSQKAMKIIRQTTQVNTLFSKAVEIKAQTRSVTP